MTTRLGAGLVGGAGFSPLETNWSPLRARTVTSTLSIPQSRDRPADNRSEMSDVATLTPAEDSKATYLAELAYMSAATHSMSTPELEQILTVARRNNVRLGITGVLLYSDGSFLQVLEGPAHAVDEIFEQLETDPRHCNVVLVSRRLVAERSFGDWQMGFVDFSHHANNLDGFVDFFRDGVRVCREHQDTRPVERLLDGFREGRWHQHVS